MHKILIVEDEPEVLSTVKTLIESHLSSCDIYTAGNGLDAFVECQKNQFDLIITDHKMPFMTGAALVIGIRTRETQNKNTTVIMLSSFIDMELKEKLKIQNVKFINKPFTPDDLIDVVRTYLI